ncbi:MAG: iron-sulfur cluster assembly scaffold protein [bacterium]|nr:iron-sulfur cluster assembly scaffold protein [bacterium]
MTDLYHEVLLDLARYPSHVGVMKNPDLIISGTNASCGDKVTIYLKIEDNQIVDFSWVGSGCIISQAAMSSLAEKIVSERHTVSEIKAMTQQEILTWLHLEVITPGRIKCLTLGLHTLQSNV